MWLGEELLVGAQILKNIVVEHEQRNNRHAQSENPDYIDVQLAFASLLTTLRIRLSVLPSAENSTTALSAGIYL